MNLFERVNQQQEVLSQIASPDIMQSIRQTTIPQFQVNLTPSEQAIVTQRMSLSDYPEEEKEKWEQAILMSRQYDVPLEYAIDNLDTIVQYQTGRKPQFNQTFTRSLINSAKIGEVTATRAELAKQWYWAEKNGEDTSELERQIAEKDNEIAELYDYTPRNVFQEFLKGAAQTLAYSSIIAGASLAGNAVGNIVAPGVGTALSIGASFAAGYNLTKYSSYYDMVKAGVDPKAADWTSTLSGGIQAAIESILGIESGLGRIAAGGSANFVTRLMKNMYLNGSFNAIGLGATRYLTNVMSEGIEEFLQEVTDNVFTNIAYTNSEMDAPYTINDIWRNSIESFVQGAGAALILGGVGTIAETVNDVNYAKSMRADALGTDSKQVFIEKHMDDEQLGTIGKNRRREALSQTYENIHAQYDEAIEGLSTAEARTVDVDFIEQPENVGSEDEEGNIVEAKTSKELPELKRLDNGRLRVQENPKVVTMADGTERHQLLVGSNDRTKNRYGYVTYSLNEDGSIDINSVKTRAGYQNITSDIVQELARRNPGTEIRWDPSTEAQQNVKQSLINNSPTGKLNWYEPMTDQQEQAELAQKIGKAFTNLNRQERDVAAVLMQLRAQAKGMTANEYMDSYITNMEQAELGKDKHGRTITGRTIINGAKAVIQAGQSSNFSTFAHETFHVIRNEMTDEENQRLANAFKEAVDTDSFKRFVAASRKVLQMSYSQIKDAINAMDGKTWTNAQEEIAARMFESYLLNGKTTNSKLADLFSKIAEFFRKIYGVLRGQKMLNDNIVKAYDSLFERSAEAQTTSTQSDGERTLNQSELKEELKEELKPYTRMTDVPYELQKKLIAYYRSLKTVKDGSINVEESKYALGTGDNETERDKYFYESGTAKVLGDIGADILLLPESNVLLMFKGEHSDSVLGEVWGELKNPKSSNRIQHHFGKAMAQGDCMILDIDRIPNYTADAAARRINGILKDVHANVDAEGKGVVIVANKQIAKIGIIKNGTLNWVPQAQVRTNPLLHLNNTIKEIIVNKKALEASRTAKTFDQTDFSSYDSEYFDAINSNDLEKAQSIVNEVARLKGYFPESDYQGTSAFNGKAPSTNGYYATREERKQAYNDGGFEGDSSLGDYKAGIDPMNLELFLTNPNMARTDYDKESVANLKKGLKNGTITMYRSVPSNIEESSFRNGDWVTPSKAYAVENADVHGWDEDYKVIEQKVPIDDIWWDGNDINEWGYDDGNGYAYQNTENNRKLLDVITRDENGDIIPPSQRFNAENPSVFYQTQAEDDMLMEDAKAMDREEFLSYADVMYEDYSEAELNEIWNKAHGMNNDGQKREGPAITEGMTDEEKDEEFLRYFESDEALRGLINRLRDAYSLRRDVNRYGIGANTEEEYNEIVQDLERLDRFMREASPFFRNIVSGNGVVSETSLKNIRTTMENAPRMYRDLYAEVTGDENLRASVYDDYLPNIDEPGFDELRGMSIADRKRLSEKIENETLKQKILSGEETLVGEAEKVVKSMDDEIAKLEEQLKQMQAKNNEYYNAFNDDEKRLVKLNEQLADAKHQLDEYNRKIRLKLDKSDRVNPKTITDRNTVQEKIDLLNEQIKKLRATDRTKAAEERRQAIADLKQEIREKQSARREAKKVHDYKLKLASAITREVSNAVDYEYRQRIMAIQALVDPNFRQNTIWYEGKKYTIDEFRQYFRSMFEGVSEEELNEEIRKDYEAFGLTRKQAERLLQKNLNDYTVAELEQMAQQVADLAEEGRQVWQAKQDEKRRQARRTQNQIIAEIMSRPHAKTPDEMPTPGSAEDKKAQKNVRKQIRNAWFKTLNMDRKAQMLDNDEKGVAYNLLIRKRREVQSNESKAKNARINPVMDLMNSLGVKPQDFYETVDITMNGKTEKFTYSDLFYGLAAQKEQDNYRAFVYGTLVTIGEKERLGGDNDLIQTYGDAKNAQFVRQAEAALAQKPDMVKVFQAMEDDLQNHSTAMAEFSIREYNTVPNFMDYYLPIYRADFNGTKLAAQMSEDVKRQNPGKNAALPSMGRWKERIDISANNQRPVHMDYFSTWLETVEEVEHTIATLGYERDLKRVFQNFGSENLKSYIDANFGRGMLKDIDNYINEVGNPPVYNDVQGTEKTIRALRGNLYSAYLGFKASGIVLQAITSPAPTLGYVNPFSLAKHLLKMTFEYRKTWDFVSSMSEFMKNRSMDPALEIVKREAQRYTDPKLKRAYANFLEKGTMGLEVIDKWAVTASWMALYEKKLNEFEFQTDPKAMEQAARYADEIIAETQPLSDPAELAPLYKGRSEWAKAFMQFTTSMNVIWNNVTYDIIAQSRKKGTFKRNVGMLFGYALAGAILGAVQNGTGDEDKPEEQVRQFFYNMTTQFTGSVPIFGTMVDELAQGVITGEASKFYGTSSIFPGIEDTMKGLSQLGVAFSQEDEKKRKQKLETAMKNMTKGVGLLAGVPTSALKELDRTFFDEDGFTFNPAALAGRRD